MKFKIKNIIMGKHIIIVILLFGINLVYADDKVYIGMTNTSNTVLLEDNSFSYNESLWQKDEYGYTYQNYIEFIINFTEKNPGETDTNGNLTYWKYYPEFEKLTDIRIGDKYYVSTFTGVYEATVTGYVIHPDDSYINSNMFYVLLDVKNDKPLETGKEAIISTFAYITILRGEGKKETEQHNKGLDVIRNNTIGKKFISLDEEGNNEIKKEFTDFNNNDFRIFKGSFTETDTEQFFANFSQRFSFMYYINTSYIINNNGEIIFKVLEAEDKDFNYYIVKGIIDIDKDGIDEVLIDIGYYEGTGLFLHKYSGNGYKIIAEGFIAGV